MTRRVAALVMALWSGSALAVTCEEVTFEAQGFTVCSVDAATEELRLLHSDGTGRPYGTFGALEEAVDGTLVFAMNAGMFHRDLAPVGLYVEDGQEIARVQPNAGPGNFGLLPNGLLCLNEGRAEVIETLRWLDGGPECRDATQSGPILVIGGDLHPKLLPDSTSRFIRNGVGTSGDGRRAVFVISDDPVNFHTFARFFRDGLGLPDALYLDGKVSRLHAPQLGRSDGGFPVGPLVAVVE